MTADAFALGGYGKRLRGICPGKMQQGTQVVTQSFAMLPHDEAQRKRLPGVICGGSSSSVITAQPPAWAISTVVNSSTIAIANER